MNEFLSLACIDGFANQIEKPTTLIINNAPTHTSNEFNDCLEDWEKRGLTIYRIPPDSPELNHVPAHLAEPVQTFPYHNSHQSGRLRIS